MAGELTDQLRVGLRQKLMRRRTARRAAFLARTGLGPRLMLRRATSPRNRAPGRRILRLCNEASRDPFWDRASRRGKPSTPLCGVVGGVGSVVLIDEIHEVAEVLGALILPITTYRTAREIR